MHYTEVVRRLNHHGYKTQLTEKHFSVTQILFWSEPFKEWKHFANVLGSEHVEECLAETIKNLYPKPNGEIIDEIKLVTERINLAANNIEGIENNAKLQSVLQQLKGALRRLRN